ncbi:hypothetical protein A3715_17825 [Oleiphilus sp. HI0009]|nr:hypothetical protein A3715_17825 [Oleiphilus sp. HI0009]
MSNQSGFSAFCFWFLCTIKWMIITPVFFIGLSFIFVLYSSIEFYNPDTGHGFLQDLYLIGNYFLTLSPDSVQLLQIKIQSLFKAVFVSSASIVLIYRLVSSPFSEYYINLFIMQPVLSLFMRVTSAISFQDSKLFKFFAGVSIVSFIGFSFYAVFFLDNKNSVIVTEVQKTGSDYKSIVQLIADAYSEELVSIDEIQSSFTQSSP